MIPSSLARSLFCLLVLSGAAPAAIIYQASDLADEAGGGDRWEYHYTLSKVDLEAGQGFSIFFDRSVYRDLEVGILDHNADWSLISIQPDHALVSAGFFDGQALVDDPFAGPLSVSFEWHGEGSPGSQPFLIYDTDFSELSSGQTRVVPEPDFTVFLFASLGLCCLRRVR